MDQNFPKILAVQAVVINEKDEILLIQRAKEPDNGKWEVVAGYVNPGERLVDAVKRHIEKDTGITEVEEITFTGNYYDEPNRHPGTFCIPFVFKVTIKSTSTLKEGKWFSKEELKNLKIAFDNKNTLQDLKLL